MRLRLSARAPAALPSRSSPSDRTQLAARGALGDDLPRRGSRAADAAARRCASTSSWKANRRCGVSSVLDRVDEPLRGSPQGGDVGHPHEPASTFRRAPRERRFASSSCDAICVASFASAAMASSRCRSCRRHHRGGVEPLRLRRPQQRAGPVRVVIPRRQPRRHADELVLIEIRHARTSDASRVRSSHGPSRSRLAVPISSSTAATSCRYAASGSACSRHTPSNRAASASRRATRSACAAARRSASTRSTAAACFSTSRSRATTRRCMPEFGVERYASAPMRSPPTSTSDRTPRACPRQLVAQPSASAASTSARSAATSSGESLRPLQSPGDPAVEVRGAHRRPPPIGDRAFHRLMRAGGPVLVRNRSATERAAHPTPAHCSQPEPTPRRAMRRRRSAFIA